MLQSCGHKRQLIVAESLQSNICPLPPLLAVRRDNPRLTTRREGGHQPARIVMSRTLDLPEVGTCRATMPLLQPVAASGVKPSDEEGCSATVEWLGPLHLLAQIRASSTTTCLLKCTHPPTRPPTPCRRPTCGT